MSQPENSIDPAIYRELKHFLHEKFADFIESFITCMDVYIAEAGKAIEQGNVQAIHDNVHPMKSICHAVGASNLAAIAERVQHIADEHAINGTAPTKEDLGPLYEKMEREYASIKAFLLQDNDITTI